MACGMEDTGQRELLDLAVVQRPLREHPLTAMREAAWTWWRNIPPPRDMAPPILVLKKYARLRNDVCHVPVPLYTRCHCPYLTWPDINTLPRQGGAVLIASAVIYIMCEQREARLLVEDMPVLGAGEQEFLAAAQSTRVRFWERMRAASPKFLLAGGPLLKRDGTECRAPLDVDYAMMATRLLGGTPSSMGSAMGQNSGSSYLRQPDVAPGYPS